MTVEVPLRARDGSVRGVALIDDEDAERVSAHRWCLGSEGYALRGVRLSSGRMRMFALQRELVGLRHGDPRVVDFENGDRLDCRRSNLRVVTRAQDAQNIHGGRGRSEHRGVSWDRHRGKWKARATVGGCVRNLGYFEQEQEAAAAAAAFRAEHMPFSV